ncbi:MAG: hypothetical protein A2143_00765 [Gallionellales bacterium RBG_16_57_15]|nr:MAG: hypothetical protein A2143_00765 [Gallionellales bacterium RBG_16_57_15]
MTTSLFTTLYDEVLADVPGVPQPVALNAIRNAAIELCEKSGVWSWTAAAMNSVALQASYAFVPEADTEVVGVVAAWYNGVQILPRTGAQLEAEVSITGSGFVVGTPWHKQSGTPKYFTIERADQFILSPYPTEALAAAIEMKLTLKPTRTATGMEKWVMDKHFETIAHGAKAKLCAMHSKPWSNADQASYHAGKFDNGITSASVYSSQNQSLPMMVSAPAPI